jgi:hypothetical protein
MPGHVRFAPKTEVAPGFADRHLGSDRQLTFAACLNGAAQGRNFTTAE